MKNIKKTGQIGLLIMGILSIFHLINLTLVMNTTTFGGMTVIVGLIAFFLNRKFEGDQGLLNIKNVPEILKNREVLLLIFLPIAIDILNLFIAKLAVPEYLAQLKSRAEFLTTDIILILFFQLALFAFGEEIAWRGFFQNQLTKGISFKPALFLSSILFTIAHYSLGNTAVIIYDLLFVFINTLIFGIIFHKTKNIYVTTISHLISNAFGILIIFFI